MAGFDRDTTSNRQTDLGIVAHALGHIVAVEAHGRQQDGEQLLLPRLPPRVFQEGPRGYRGSIPDLQLTLFKFDTIKVGEKLGTGLCQTVWPQRQRTGPAAMTEARVC